MQRSLTSSEPCARVRSIGCQLTRPAVAVAMDTVMAPESLMVKEIAKRTGIHDMIDALPDAYVLGDALDGFGDFLDSGDINGDGRDDLFIADQSAPLTGAQFFRTGGRR